MQQELPDELPPIHNGDLDEPTLDALMDDLEACARILVVRVKGSATQHADRAKMHLRDAVALLRAGNVQAVQIRYVYQQAEWSDTIMQSPKGYRVVRFQLP